MVSLSWTLIFFLYHPQTKLREGNVFTGVYDSVHRGRGACSGGSGPWGREEEGCLLPGVGKGGESWWRSPRGTVTKVITHLLTDTLSVLVIKSAFSLLPLGRYLLPLTTQNRYQSIGSSGKFFFTTTSKNITIDRWVIPLVTKLLLDLVMIHWICWIQRKSFRENSIDLYLDTSDDAWSIA